PTTLLPPRSTLFPYTTLFRSLIVRVDAPHLGVPVPAAGRHLRPKVHVRRRQGDSWTFASDGEDIIVDHRVGRHRDPLDRVVASLDRKSTRLNSSHVSISYAVF